jgi:hypothetical protein
MNTALYQKKELTRNKVDSVGRCYGDFSPNYFEYRLWMHFTHVSDPELKPWGECNMGQ